MPGKCAAEGGRTGAHARKGRGANQRGKARRGRSAGAYAHGQIGQGRQAGLAGNGMAEKRQKGLKKYFNTFGRLILRIRLFWAAAKINPSQIKKCSTWNKIFAPRPEKLGAKARPAWQLKIRKNKKKAEIKSSAQDANFEEISSGGAQKNAHFSCAFKGFY